MLSSWLRSPLKPLGISPSRITVRWAVSSAAGKKPCPGDPKFKKADSLRQSVSIAAPTERDHASRQAAPALALRCSPAFANSPSTESQHPASNRDRCGSSELAFDCVLAAGSSERNEPTQSENLSVARHAALFARVSTDEQAGPAM